MTRVWSLAWATARRSIGWRSNGPNPADVERFTDLPLDRYVTIVEGEGKWGRLLGLSA